MDQQEQILGLRWNYHAGGRVLDLSWQPLICAVLYVTEKGQILIILQDICAPRILVERTTAQALYSNRESMKTKTFPASYLNALLVLQIAFHFIVPIRQLIRVPLTYSGIVLIVIGLGLNVSGIRYLERQNTTSDFRQTASRLVATGPFQFSRNPIYLSGVLLSTGVSLFLGSFITFLFPVVLFLILNSVHIPDEEGRLEQLFGEEFLAYKRNVRRWL